MAQNLATLGGDDFDPASASAAGRLYDDIPPKHPGNAERINGADGVELAAAKLYAVFCPFPGERISIENAVSRRVHAQKIMGLQVGNERSKIFRGETGLFAYFVQARRPTRPRKKLDNRSPHPVLRRLKNVIPSFTETNPRAIAPDEGVSRCRSRHD